MRDFQVGDIIRSKSGKIGLIIKVERRADSDFDVFTVKIAYSLDQLDIRWGRKLARYMLDRFWNNLTAMKEEKND